MSASGLLDDLVVGRTYKVEVRPASDGTYKWDIRLLGPDRISDDHYARMVADGYQHPQDGTGFHPRATLSTPPVTDEQAREIALTWLTTVEGVAPTSMDCLLMLPGGNERVHPAAD